MITFAPHIGGGARSPRYIQYGLFAVVVALAMVLLAGSIWDNTIMSRQYKSCEVMHHPYGYAVRARYTPDATAYILMATVAPKNMIAPYKYRVLTPTLVAGAMAWVPNFDEAFVFVNMVALYLFYLMSGLTVFALGGNLWTALAGFMGVLSFWHVYNYANPYTVEPVFYLTAAILIYALVTNRFGLFALVLTLGLLNKESLLFLAPAWIVTRQYRKAALATALGFMIYLLPRVQDLAAQGWYLDHYAGTVTRHIIQHPGVVLLTVFCTWGLLWVILYGGARKDERIAWCLVLSTVGALIACIGAADHGRMLASISPAAFPSISLFFKGVRL
jgi:hypothetical protein